MDAKPAFIQQLRLSTLDLHKSLLDAQRIRYERAHGRISTSGEFLGIVLEHPEFAWLRALSALIARLDEWIEDQDAEGVDEFTGILTALRSLIEPEGKIVSFSSHYWSIVNDVPEVLIEHVKLWRLIESAKPAQASKPGTPGPSARQA